MRLSDRLQAELAKARSAPSTLTINNVANCPASIYKGRRIKNLAHRVSTMNCCGLLLDLEGKAEARFEALASNVLARFEAATCAKMEGATSNVIEALAKVAAP